MKNKLLVTLLFFHDDYITEKYKKSRRLLTYDFLFCLSDNHHIRNITNRHEIDSGEFDGYFLALRYIFPT